MKPPDLLDVADACEKAGKNAEALARYRKLLADFSDRDVVTSRKEDLQKRLKRLSRR